MHSVFGATGHIKGSTFIILGAFKKSDRKKRGCKKFFYSPSAQAALIKNGFSALSKRFLKMRLRVFLFLNTQFLRIFKFNYTQLLRVLGF